MQLLIARKGKAELMEAPDPSPSENEVLIETAFSAISPGTELSALSQNTSNPFSILKKGLNSWDKIKKSIAQRGWKGTLSKIESKLDQNIPLGYSISGRVLQVGSKVRSIKVGDWVVAVGPSANHATRVIAPQLFCAPFSKPELAQDASAAALACVGIHALHRAELDTGAEVGVFGLGVIGQFMVQALRASGHKVIAFDPVESRRNDGSHAGAETHDPTRFNFEQPTSSGKGLDAVFICAKADSAEVMHQAAALCRKHGRLIVVGEFPIQLPRDDGYEKELEIRISAAYGEGRYDPAYPHLDQDYPAEQSRWSVQRNLQLFLGWLEEKKLSPSQLRPAVVQFSEAPEVYSKLGESASTLTVIQYAKVKSANPTAESPEQSRRAAGSTAVGIKISVIGAGNFAAETHLPNLRALSDKFSIQSLIGRNPLKTASLATRFQIKHASCDISKAYIDYDIEAFLIATPHAQHAEQVIGALKNGKHVYVEKPLCISLDELKRIQETQSHSSKKVLFVGFNRRHAPLSQKLMEIRKKDKSPIDIRYLFRAAPLPANHWYHDPSHGGRFIGEVCHAIDWILWFVSSPLKSQTVFSGIQGEADIFLQFEDSSRAHLRLQPVLKELQPKETVEIRHGTIRHVIHDFTSLQTFDREIMKTEEKWKSKGHREALDAFAMAIAHPQTGNDPYGFFKSSKLVLELDQALRG